MLDQHAAAVTVFHPIHTHFRPPPSPARQQSSMPEERLPFTVRIVSNQGEMEKAVHIRHAAYARHVPTFAETLRLPEATDSDPGVVVLLAESKLDGSALGTMRIQTNRFKPLSIEQSVELPAWLKDRPLAEATRLGVTGEKVGRVVKTVLFKAFFLYCRQTGIESMTIAGRPPIDRQYERLLFKDVYPGMGYTPLRHAGNIPHRIMSLDVNRVEPLWAEEQHPLFDFFFRTRHPDVDVGDNAISNLNTISGSEFRKLAVMME